MEEKKQSLFREKSIELVESPESLNDYLRVTSPGVWLVLAAVILILVGVVVWGILGRIETSVDVAVVSDGGSCVAFMPYDAIASLDGDAAVTVDGTSYALIPDADSRVTVITADTNPYIRVAGGLEPGDVTVTVTVDAALVDGVYTGSVVTESLRPMSLLLQ